jgi:hypothetical protein
VSIYFFQSHQQEWQHQVGTATAAAAGAVAARVATPRTSPAFVFVPHHVAATGGRQDDVENITPRPLPSNDCKDEERAFLKDFQEHVIDLISEFRRHFPYRQLIRWSIEYGDDKEHNLHILVKPSRSMNHH